MQACPDSSGICSGSLTCMYVVSLSHDSYRYEFMYNQAVGAEDAFLGMGDKDPGSHTCENIVLKVKLPGVQAVQELDLDVKQTYARLNSPD